MAAMRTKTLSYHRAEYFSDNPGAISLGLCIKQATDKCPHSGNRSISRPGGQTIRLAHMVPGESNGYFLHLTVDTPGEHASVVKKVAETAIEIPVATVAPPNDAEFMDGDAFLYVRGNDVCLCMTTIRAGTVRDFFHKFFEESGIRKDAREFHFVNALDPNKVEFLMQRGVREIDLKGTLHRASVDYAKRKTEAVGIFDLVRKHFNAIVGSPHDVTPDGLRVEITLKTDKKRKGFTIGHKKLEKIAVSIIENSQEIDEYSIITNDGQQVNPSDIILHSIIDIDSMGKSVRREKAWVALLDYYNHLSRSGQLEQ